EAVLFDVDGVELDHGVDESPADAGGVVFVDADFGRDAIAEDDASAALHEEERRTDDIRVLADEIDFRGRSEMRMHGVEDLRFADHVVRFRGDGAEWGSAEDVLFAGDFEEIGKIRMAAGELFDCDSVFDAVDFAAETVGEGGEI